MSRGERKEHMDELLALIEKYKVLNYASERSDSSSSRRRYRSSGPSVDGRPAGGTVDRGPSRVRGRAGLVDETR